MATQDDAAESRLNPERPSRLSTLVTPRTAPLVPPSWHSFPNPLQTFVHSTPALFNSFWKPRPIFAFPTLTPYRSPLLRPLNLLKLTLPCFSPSPFCPWILTQIQRRCWYPSKQEPPCLPIHAADPRPATWTVPPAPLTRSIPRLEPEVNRFKNEVK